MGTYVAHEVVPTIHYRYDGVWGEGKASGSSSHGDVEGHHVRRADIDIERERRGGSEGSPRGVVADILQNVIGASPPNLQLLEFRHPSDNRNTVPIGHQGSAARDGGAVPEVEASRALLPRALNGDPDGPTEVAHQGALTV